MVRTLPDFERPPVAETAIGVRFAPIPGWNAFHYGLLLQEFKAEYPVHELRPPIGSVSVQFPPSDADFTGVPVRCWFINQTSTELIQVQNDCFIRNWRKTESSQGYLHYEFFRPLFERDWSKFQEFLATNNLPAPDIWQCEVSYINQFVRGREWHDFDDLGHIYSIWGPGKLSPLLSRPQMVTFATSYLLPNELGTLQFISQPGIRKSDGAEIIQLAVTAIGRPGSTSDAGILAWLDAGHDAVVQGFTDFTTKPAHAIWGKK